MNKIHAQKFTGLALLFRPALTCWLPVARMGERPNPRRWKIRRQLN
jgi:hypothetical protein